MQVTVQNISQVLQESQIKPLVLTFYAPSMPESTAFVATLEALEKQHAGQFILGTVNCEEEQQLAMQFQLQTLPTTYFFKNAQPVDALQGVVDSATLNARLQLILPREEELKFQQALDLMEKGEATLALPLLKEAWTLSDKRSPEIAFVYAQAYLILKRADAAQAVLDEVKLEDRKSEWHALQAEIELMKKAADTPEIQQLQQDYQQNPTHKTALKLAAALQQAGRSAEALSLLFNILQTDLSAENGEVKQEFLAILATLGNGDSLVNEYRRKLYSLLY